MHALPPVPSASVVVQGHNDPPLMQPAGNDSGSTSREPEDDRRRAAIVWLSRLRIDLPRCIVRVATALSTQDWNTCFFRLFLLGR